MVRLALTGLTCLALSACAPRASTAVVAPTVEVAVRPVGDRPIVTGDADVHDDGRSAGDHVEVEWNGSWWPAVLLEKRDAAWLIHYDGYDDDWDEVVGEDRIRDRRADDGPVMLPMEEEDDP